MDDFDPPPPNIPPLSPIVFPESPFCQQKSPVSHLPKRVSSPARSVSSFVLPELLHGTRTHQDRRIDLDDSLVSYETSNQHMPDFQRFHMVCFLLSLCFFVVNFPPFLAIAFKIDE